MIGRWFWLLALGLCGLGAAPAHADRFQIEFDAAVLSGVSLGRISLEGAVTAQGYSVLARVETAGVAQGFDQTRISAAATGTVGTAGPISRRYDLSHHYAQKFRRVLMVRRASGPLETTITPGYRDMGRPPASPAQIEASRDPVTSLIALGLSVAASGGCNGSSQTFDGRQLYTLSLAPAAPDRPLNAGGYNGVVRVCTLRYAPLAGFPGGRMPTAAQIPAVTVWFAPPPPGGRLALPVRFEAQTPAGRLALSLRRYSLVPG